MAFNAVKLVSDIFSADGRVLTEDTTTFNLVRNTSGNVTPNNVVQLVGFSLDFDTVDPAEVEAIKTVLTSLVTIAPTYIGVCDGFVQMGYFFKRPFEKSKATTSLIQAYTETLASVMVDKGLPAHNQNTAVDRTVSLDMVVVEHAGTRLAAPDSKFIEAHKKGKKKADDKPKTVPTVTPAFRGDIRTLDGLAFMRAIDKYKGMNADGDHLCECLLNSEHVAILNLNGEAGLYCERCMADTEEQTIEFFVRAITDSGNMKVAEDYCQLYRSDIVRAGMSDFLPSSSPKVIADAFMAETPYVKVGLIFVQNNFRRYNENTKVWEVLSEARINEDIRRYDGVFYVKGNGVDKLQVTSAVCADVRTAIAEKLATSGDNARIIENVKVPVPGLLFSNGFLGVDGKLITDAGTIKSFGCTETQCFDTPWIDPKDAPSFEEECPMLAGYFKRVLSPGYLTEYNVTGPDPRRAVMLEAVGMALLGLGTKVRKLLCLIGEPGTGKSTFIEVLTELFPPGVRCSIHPQDFYGFHKWPLVGARINLVDDVKRAPIQEDGDLKIAITGGVLPIERKHHDGFDVNPIAGHIYGSNNRINVRGGSTGLAARMIEIDFNADVLRHTTADIQDYSKKTVAAERYAIIRHFIYAALDRVLNHEYRLTAQPDAAEKFAELAAPTTPVESFFSTLVFDETARVTSDAVYDAFKSFCEANGFRFASTKPSFDKLFGNWRRIKNKRDWTHKNSAGNMVFKVSLPIGAGTSLRHGIVMAVSGIDGHAEA